MLGYFPNSYPDELLYSLCARYSDQMQYFKKYTALELLFGHRGPVSSIDLPNRLGYLTATLPFGYGYSVDDLINKHTLLPYYGAFLPSNKISTVRQDMEADNKPKAVSRAGLATTQIKPPEQLRYCPVCVEMDRSQFGECYWHRVHQLPGVEICPHHSVLLEQSNIAIRRKTHQYDFISAEKATQVAYKVKELELPNAFQEDLLHLACESAWLLNHPYFACEMQTLHEQYLVAFIERELAPYQGTVVQASKLFRQFRQRFPHQLLKLLQCDFDEGNKNNWLYRLNSSSPVVHPLYHLLVIRFLGYTLSEFIDLPTVFHPFGQKPWPCLNPACKYYRQPKIENIEINFQGGTRQPTGKFACECGFIYFRTGPDQSPEDRFRRNVRVQAYGAVWEEELQCLLKTPNLSIEKIAERLEVSPSTVHNQAVKLGLVSSSLKPSVCREDLATSLKAENDQSTFHIKVEKYQAEWLAILETNKGLGRKEITEKYTRVYSWLRNNDPTWLRANMPPKKQRQTPRPRVDWAELDEQLAKRVAESAERLRNKTEKPERITISSIARDIGEKHLLCDQLEKLPKTAQVLEQVVESREAFAIRRIQWTMKSHIQERVHPRRWEFIKRAGVSTTQENPEVRKAIDDAIQKLNSLEFYGDEY